MAKQYRLAGSTVGDTGTQYDFCEQNCDDFVKSIKNTVLMECNARHKSVRSMQYTGLELVPFQGFAQYFRSVNSLKDILSRHVKHFAQLY